MKRIPRTPLRNPRTPRTQSPASVADAEKPKDTVNVFCRLRPLRLEVDLTSLRVINSTTICMNSQEPSQDRQYYRQQQQPRETLYKFRHIFESDASQHDVYAAVAQPLVENLIRGRDSLLFTYGVTGSGKTHTMTGDSRNRGILPRCLDQLFRTICDNQANKFVFKPDKLNGFEILSESEALQEQMSVKRKFVVARGRKSALQTSVDLVSTPGIDEENMYSVFITYIEIYNNSVYDLLESDGSQRSLQSRIIREDARHHMFAHGVTEMEVKTMQEALQVFQMGQKRKHMAHTALNQESSRSHSVFNIRLVQAPIEPPSKEQMITVSQLSLVDLAGSERSSRAKTSGSRLREAGNINNSLMTLRTCLEYLRENQQMANNAAKKIPYRDSKLTHMFKSYFEGEGQVAMIVCINPRIEDYDENLQVLKFAEMAQEVQILPSCTPGRLKSKIPISHKTRPKPSLGPDFPSYQLSSLPKTKLQIQELKSCLEQRRENRQKYTQLLQRKCDNFRQILMKMDQDNLRMRIGESLEENKENISSEKRSKSSESLLEEKAFVPAKQTDIYGTPRQYGKNLNYRHPNELYSMAVRKLDHIKEYRRYGMITQARKISQESESDVKGIEHNVIPSSQQ